MRQGMNDACKWPSESATALHLQNRADQQHLVDDVRVAEELGIRYWDAQRAQGLPYTEWARTRHLCNEKLFAAIAGTHRLTPTDIGRARQRLVDIHWDPAIELPAVALFAVATILAARWIRRRFPDERIAAVAAAAFLAPSISGLTVGFGLIWASVVQMIRVGDTHGSYRVGRAALSHHAGLVSAVGVVLFSLVAVWIYRRPVARRRADLPS